MMPEDIQTAFDVLCTWDHPFQVHLTGGEPFLNFPLLLKAVQFAADRHFRVYVETNAGWCINKNLAGERFAELREAGLAAVLISASPFHAENIPVRNTLLGVQAAKEVFGPQRVQVFLPDWLLLLEQFGPDETVSLKTFIDEFGMQQTGTLFWTGYGLLGGGRAGYQLGYLTKRYSAESFSHENCTGEILYANHSHFDLYGNFIPAFCGGISLGKWEDYLELQTGFMSGSSNGLLKILIESGPYGLYKMASENFSYLQEPAGYVDKCHLCVDVRRYLHQQAVFPELQPTDFYRRF